MKHSSKPAFPKRPLSLEPLERRHLLSGLMEAEFPDVLALETTSANMSLARFASDYRTSTQVPATVTTAALARPAAGTAGYSAALETAEGESSGWSVELLSPVDGSTVDTATVTLSFAPLDGYLGKYMVRLHESNWDGQQALGFQHDATAHYLCLLTSQTRLAVPVKPGASYKWWVHTPDSDVASANFTVAAHVVDPVPDPRLNVPRLLSPVDGSVLTTASVTLEFEPVDGYLGKHLVRLQPDDWNGTQAAGFTHDSTAHYLSLSTYQTKITVPVQAGASYTWWVHKPDGDIASGSFTVDPNVNQPTTSPQPDVPQLLGPDEGSVADTTAVRLEFQPIPGYVGPYFVRLHDNDWDGKQAPGFRHDANAHYLCLLTDQTRITVPVKPGASYTWWVHRRDGAAVVGTFSVSSEAEPPAASQQAPTILGPLTGTLVATNSVTLSFQPVDGYVGPYLVRMHDFNWDGRQAGGFVHDSHTHYLSVATTQTSVTVPVKPDSLYMWWVHIPGKEAPTAEFITAASDFPALPIPLSTDQFAPPELIDGRFRCTSLATWSGQNVDVSRALQYCIDRVPAAATLEIPPGQYQLNHQLHVDRHITITTQGKSLNDPPAAESDADCAELIASRALNEAWGMLYATDLEAIHHIIFNGNKTQRLNTLAARMASTLVDNRYAFNATISADDFTLSGNVFKNAVGGTGLLIHELHHRVTICDNLFARNGVHTQRNLWADGLTIADLVDSRIEGNRFIDNTDIDLIFGGLVDSFVQGNEITHTADIHGGAFAGIMIQKWPSTSGDYTGTVIRNNIVDGGPNRTCGSAIYLGSEGWYDQTPYGSHSSYQTGATVHNNVIRNVQNGMYIAATGFAVHDNSYENAHGGTIRTDQGLLQSTTPIVVSPTSHGNDFGGEDVALDTRALFTYASWRGHIPNWPF